MVYPDNVVLYLFFTIILMITLYTYPVFNRLLITVDYINGLNDFVDHITGITH